MPSLIGNSTATEVYLLRLVIREEFGDFDRTMLLNSKITEVTCFEWDFYQNEFGFSELDSNELLNLA